MTTRRAMPAPTRRVRHVARSSRSRRAQAEAELGVFGKQSGASEWDFAGEASRRAELDARPVVAPGAGLIAVLVPVLARPHRVAPLLSSFRAATGECDATLYFIAQHSDTDEVAAIREALGDVGGPGNGDGLILVDDHDRSWAKKINRGYERTTESWLLLGADDLAFRPGWVDTIRGRGLLYGHRGVIGTNDLGNPGTMIGTHSTHPLVCRGYADVMGTADERLHVLHEGYDHNFPDNELVATARKRGLYIHCCECVIEHLHPAWHKGHTDATYARGQKNFFQDQKLFEARARRFGL
jgi:hypothetical protein